MTDNLNGTPDEAQADQNRRMKADRGGRSEALQSELETVLSDMRRDCQTTFESSDLNDTEGHRTIRLYLQVLSDLEQRLTYFIETGKVAQQELMTKLN